MKYFTALFCSILFSAYTSAQSPTAHHLSFNSLATSWDEGIPLGNGWLGALIWQKEGKLRMSLDRADLWDDRPMPKIDQLSFDWVADQVNKGQYDTVQQIGDAPYEANAAPTKLPGAALEFDISAFGKVISNDLDIATGKNTIRFEDGTEMLHFIHATRQVGYFIITGTDKDIIPELKVPDYQLPATAGGRNSVTGLQPASLGYDNGTIVKKAEGIFYHQPTFGNHYYEVLVRWSRAGNTIRGAWTISVDRNVKVPGLSEKEMDIAGHDNWWREYWAKSSVNIPDKTLERQYYLELYKMGCVARFNTPAITLQAVWTADNGSLPPWKGDFHHDLNTELSYWPFYTSNHLEEAASFTNWLWSVRKMNKRWTKQYFGSEGLNVPGVTTISGREMGGWIQYSMSPTTIAWLSQHFFWQWKYSSDSKFYRERLVPYYTEAAIYLSQHINRYFNDKAHFLSSSPEYHDNDIRAWFKDWTNYDLALMHFFADSYLEILREKPLNLLHNDYKNWVNLKAQLPALDVNETGLTIAPGHNLEESHRHIAQLMAIYPLGLLQVEKKEQKATIDKSLQWLEKKGTRYWCGYSFSWAACIYARAQEAEKAADMLRIFANNFTSSNSFHLNGDQKGGEHSDFRYRPFTLEGNFAFAQGIQEMLLQSHKGYIEVFPAVPKDWLDTQFTNFRAEGGFLVSARMGGGVPASITITATKQGNCLVKLPFVTMVYRGKNPYVYQPPNRKVISFAMMPGETVTIENGYE